MFASIARTTRSYVNTLPLRNLSSEKSVNRVTLIGRAGSDAQVKGTMDHPVVTFSMATTAGSKTDWHKISVFNPGLRGVAEKFVKQGDRLFVEGRLSYGHYVDAQGNARPITSIIADEMIFLSSSERSKQESNEDADEDEQSL